MGAALRSSRRQAYDHAEYWERRRARPKELTYLALGDSAAVGVGVDDPARGYVGVIARRLAEASAKTVRVVNLAVSGAKARDVLDGQIPRVPEVTAPDFVTCVVGGNDVAWGARFRAEGFAEVMVAIAQLLPDRSVMGLVPRFGHWPYEGRVRKANRIIGEAAGLRRHAVADIYSETRRLSLPEYLKTLAADYFHPNAVGHELWADAMWRQLIPQLSARR